MTIDRQLREKGALALGLFLLTAGCGSNHKARQLTVINKGWPLSLTPHLKAEQITFSVQANIMEGLVEFDPQMKIQPLLAETWENPDDLNWVFKIRHGVRFHDGSILTAEDVAYSLRRAKQHPGSVLKSDLVMVDSIAVIDELTVRVTTRKPYPLLLNRLVNVFIVSRRLMEKLGDDGFNRNPVGTGPYRFESFPQGGPLTLAINESYWGKRPSYQRMIIKSLEDQREALRLLASGEADIVSQLDAALAAEVKNTSGCSFALVSRPGLTLRYLGYDFGRKPFNQLKVRRAISVAVDRRDLVNSMNHGFGQPANQLVPQAVFGFNPALPEIGYDPKSARDLLAEAGYPRGLRVTLTVPEIRRKVGERLQQQMGKAGIEVSLNILPRDRFFQSVDTAGFFLFGVSSTSGDASDLFDDAIHSRAGGYGQTNRGHYSNPSLDKMIEAAAGQLDQARRLKSLQDIMSLCMEDLPRVPLYIEEEIHGVSRRVAWEPRLDMMVLGKEARPR